MGDPSKEEELRAWIHHMAEKLGAGGPGAAGAKNDPSAPERAPGGPAAAISEDQWTGLCTDWVQAIQIWCNGMQHEVNQFERDVGQRAETEDVSLQAAVIKAVLDEILPAQAKFAMTVAEVPLKKIAQELSSGAITLRAFCSAWNSGFNAFKSSRSDHEAMFAAFRDEMVAAHESYQAVSEQISYLSDNLPKGPAVRRAMLQAWIDSSQDEGWLIDEVGDIAGYFRVNIRRLDADDWQLERAVLDDTDEQQGVIATLQQEYGRSTPLEGLPFPMRLFITHGIHASVTLAEKGKGGALAFKSGMQQVFDDWRTSGKAIPKTSDLSAESALGS